MDSTKTRGYDGESQVVQPNFTGSSWMSTPRDLFFMVGDKTLRLHFRDKLKVSGNAPMDDAAKVFLEHLSREYARVKNENEELRRQLEERGR